MSFTTMEGDPALGFACCPAELPPATLEADSEMARGWRTSPSPASPTLLVGSSLLRETAAIFWSAATESMPLRLETLAAIVLPSKAMLLELLGRGVIVCFVLAPDSSATTKPIDCCLQGACCCQMGTLSPVMLLLGCLVGDLLGETGAPTLRCFCNDLLGVAGAAPLNCFSICLLGVEGAAGGVLECCFNSLPPLSTLAIRLPVWPMLCPCCFTCGVVLLEGTIFITGLGGARTSSSESLPGSQYMSLGNTGWPKRAVLSMLARVCKGELVACTVVIVLKLAQERCCRRAVG